MIVAILTAVALLALAMFFVAWAKYLEEKEKASTIEKNEKKKDAEIARLNSYISDEINDYNKAVFEKGQAEQKCEGLELGIEYLTERNDILQDRLSSLLCPTNNHIWINGVCKNCGRIQK